MFITKQNLRDLSKYRTKDHDAISIYIYASLNDKVRDFSEKLKNLFDVLKKDVSLSGASRAIKKNAGYVLAARDLLTRDFVKNKNKAFCMFISHDFCRYFEIPIRIKDQIFIDNTFYTQPLFTMLNQFQRYAVLVFNGREARLYNYYMDRLEEEAHIVHDYVLPHIKSSTGHDSSLKGKTIANKIEETFRRHLREINSFMLSKYTELGFDYLILGSHEDEIKQIKKYLHSYLAKRLAGEFKADPHDNKLAIEEKVHGVVESHRKRLKQQKED